MRKNKIYFLLAFLHIYVSGITQTSNISGIINAYTPVTSIQCNSVNVTSVSGFTVGDRVLLIQMKGATVDLTNTAAFGSISNYNDAGNYEFANIASISGNTIYFTKKVLRTYTISGLVQLIKVPQYTNANITGTLMCQPWNGTTGGVLVFEATGTITMGADINADGTGFRGGACQINGYVACSATNYFYALSTFQGAAKGEGIAVITAAYEGGRGGFANGAGGGNDHNTGGGGGSNWNVGGQGGNQAQVCGAPGFAGLGGYSLTYNNTSNKIFLGGGGGSGHQNNVEATPGTNGGGIIILKANSLTSNGFNITSSGKDNLLSANRDGAGGGGSGGTILLDIPSFTGAINIQATGGDGGKTIYSPDPLGPGGGGGGGGLWVSGAALSSNITFTANGGQPGLAGNNQPRGATAGQSGNTLTGLILPESNLTYTPPTISPATTICAGNAATLSATGGGTYSWNNGLTTSSIVVSPTSTANYTVNVTDINGCGSAISTTITVQPGPSLNINGNSTICQGQSTTLTATGGTSYIWSSGATAGSIIVSPTTNSIYSVVATNACGNDTDSISIIVSPPVQASINSNTTVCIGSGVTLSANGGTSYLWNTGASTSVITISPSSTAIYSVTVSNGVCTDISSATVTVNQNNSLSAGANTTVCTGDPATFTASGNVSYVWSTGSSASSITVTPSGFSSYTVTGTDGNGCTANAVVSASVFATVNAVVSGNLSICPGQSTSLSAAGGTSYSWSTGSTGATIIVSPSAATSYTVISFVGTCSDTDTVAVFVLTPPVAGASNATVCSGASTLLIASGGGTYLWSTGETSSSIVVNPIASTTYSVTVSAGGCSSSATSSVTALPNPNAGVTPTISILPGQSATLTATGGGTYLWDTGDTIASIIVTPTASSFFCVTVYDANNCQDTACVMVKIEPCPDDPVFYIPNAFSPNGDDENDDLRLFYSLFACISDFHITIFNRWGQLVYESYQPDFKWNGRYIIPKDTDMPGSEVYTYFMDATNLNGTKFYKKGNISLIR